MSATVLATQSRCLEFVHQAAWGELPHSVQTMVKTCLADTIAVAASGTQTELSRIIRSHALEQFAAPTSSQGARLLFDGRYCSASGTALANGMTIDSVDAHDGFKPAKGHAGCGVVAAALACHDAHPITQSTEQFLTDLVIGYELACRAAVSLHESAPDYHTSGAWVALAAAAIGSRVKGMDVEQTRQALGIAEYHGPRSQMMRCIDHPTMVKDGSGWGAMAGVSAAELASAGFTGAPAITIEAPEQAHHFNDLGDRWFILEQYFKPYPVCRWAQPAVIAALKLKRQFGFDHNDIVSVLVGTFHESARLTCREPITTEHAQYSLPFPLAAVLVHSALSVNEIDGEGLRDKTVLALSKQIIIKEIPAYSAVFPAQRISHLKIELRDGRCLDSGPTEADGDPESPLSTSQLQEKFVQFCQPVLGQTRTADLQHCIANLEAESMSTLNTLIYATVDGQGAHCG